MARVDVTVRGGGIMGLACAHALLRRGARVRLVEVAHLGAGASGGIVGALAPHAPEGWDGLKRFQFEALVMAGAWWEGVAGISGRDPGFARLGRLQPLPDAAAIGRATARAASAATLWGGAGDWQVIPATDDPWEPVSPSGFLVRDSLSARLFPRLALPALSEAIRAQGGEIVLGEDARDEGAVVWATGLAGLDALGAATGRPAGRGVKGQAALLRADAARRPQIFAPGLHVVPHPGGVVAIGSTSENDWIDATATDAALDAVIARARALVPALADAPVIERWAALRPRAATGGPLAGPWPGRPGHYILNGGFKIGFALAPLLAEGMADLILNGMGTLPDAFSPEVLTHTAQPG